MAAKDEYARTFIRELLRDGVALTSGIGSVTLGVVAATWHGSLPNWSFWIVAFVCFVYSCYRVWKTKHLELTVAQERIEKLESEDHELERRHRRAAAERLEEENRRVAALRAQEELDNQVLAVIREHFADMRQRNVLHSNMQAYNTEFFTAVAAELHVTGDQIRESMQRLNAAKRMPNLADMIVVGQWSRL